MEYKEVRSQASKDMRTTHVKKSSLKTNPKRIITINQADRFIKCCESKQINAESASTMYQVY